MKMRVIILSLICLAAIMACEVNTMYNAHNYFKAAQARPLNNQGRPNAQAIDEYTKAIKKCGMIISESRKGARLDNAYFLMSRALYYKGNSAFQAKDQFENLLMRYPKSPHVAEAKLYIAKILREINQPREAEKQLDEFVRDPKLKAKHPKALFLMADFAIKDKNYNRAQYYLERIINDYPKTKEFREAYFLFGKNYYEQKDFESSLAAFEKMQNARGIDKTMKMDGSYYIGLNHLELNNIDKAYRTTRTLVKNETRPDRIPAVRLLKARIHFAQGDSTNAKTEIEFISKNHPRTESSAAAYYYLAEFQYYKQGDISKAVSNYNRVRTEFSTSPLSSIGQAKATALGKLLITTKLNSETGTDQFKDHHFQAAESFLGALALPDSAKARYNRVILERDVLAARRDSLGLELFLLTSQMDSLTALSATLPPMPSEDSTGTFIAESDSLNVETNPAEADSAQTITELRTNLPELSDSINVAIDSTLADSLQTQPEIANPLAAIQAELREKQILAANLETRIEALDDALERFDTEFVPFSLFAIGSIIHDSNPDGAENAEVLSRLETGFPQNKYTRALAALQKGMPVRLMDPGEEEQEQRLDLYFGQISAAPDSAVVGLEELSNSIYPSIKLAANFRLGWFYSFEVIDTLAAKEYLNKVLENTQAEEYTTLTRKFYNGTNFLHHPKPEINETEVDSVKVEQTDGSLESGDLHPSPDWKFPTPAEIFSTLPDSLKIYENIPALMDSLSRSLKPVSQESNEKPGEESPEKPSIPVPDLERKEEPPLE